MSRIDLGWLLQKIRLKYPKISLKGLLSALIYGSCSLFVTSADAGYLCAITQDCRLIQTGPSSVTLTCTPIYHCDWYPDSPNPPPPPLPPPPPPPPPPPSNEQLQCLAAADAAGRQCSDAYGRAKNLCDASNALLGAGIGRGLVNVAVWKQMIAKDSKELLDVITAATGSLGFTAETVFPCEQWNSMAMSYCSGNAQNLKNSCPSR